MNPDTNLALQAAQVPQTGKIIENANTQQLNNAQATENILHQHYQNMNDREKARLTSTIVGASQLKTYLDKDDVEGAHQFLEQRRGQLHNRMATGENIDTQETDYALEKLRRGDIQGLKNDVASVIAAGQVYGIIGGMSGAPSNVQEWQYYNSLSKEDQQRYLTMKRSNQVVDLGDKKIVPNPANPAGTPTASYDVGLKPEDKPKNAKEKAQATAEGTAAGESNATATNTMNKMGGLLSAYDNLKPSALAAPSGGIANVGATAANITGIGGKAAQAQGDFSVKKAALENEIRQAFRVVGSGATSDRDAVPFINMLPNENDADDVKVAKIEAAKQALQVKVQELAKQRGMPNPFAAQSGQGVQLIRVSNGKQAFDIDPNDLPAAEAEGFKRQ